LGHVLPRRAARPAVPHARRKIRRRVTIRLLSYNIQRGGAGREEALLSVVNDCRPDIVVFQEATLPGVIEQLAKGSGMTKCASLPKLSLGFMSRIPIAPSQLHRPRV